MEYVALILAAAVVVAVIFRKPLIAAYKKQFGNYGDDPDIRPDGGKGWSDPVVVAEPVKPPADPVADYQSKLPASTLAFKGKGGDPAPVGAVDRSGDDLTDGSPKLRQMKVGKPEAFRFTVRRDAKNVEIAVMGSPGKIGEMGPLIDSIPTVRAMTKVELERMQLKYQLKLDVAPGDYTYILQVSKDGPVAVQLHQ